jgi:predicted ArsR family transcriptional regulator
MTADSIDVLMPAQSLRTLRAIGHALAESNPDSLKIAPKKLDYLQGDTITAHFDSLTDADTVKQASIKQIFARGTPGTRAKTYYQVARNGESKVTDKPNVNYALADSITVNFRKRQVHDVDMRGHVEGFYVELVTDTAKTTPAKDSAATKPAKKKPVETKKP